MRARRNRILLTYATRQCVCYRCDQSRNAECNCGDRLCGVRALGIDYEPTAQVIGLSVAGPDARGAKRARESALRGAPCGAQSFFSAPGMDCGLCFKPYFYR